MKTTIRAILVNPDEEQCKIINDLMLVFCTAVRYAFNRLLEGVEIKELEKEISRKYNLNIRQAKDAVENARQTIVSQEELLKMNFNNYSNKARKIEQILESENSNISEKKRNALTSKLDKRKRKLEHLKKYIESNAIPPVIFGTREMFLKRCKGHISNEEWKACRNNRIYSRGDKTKKGNPNLRVVIKEGMSFLEISTLEKAKNNRAIKIQVPIYLPQKFSKKTGRINGRNYRKMFLDYLEKGEAYQVEIIRKNNKIYVHITFEEENKVVENTNTLKLGIDTNPDGLALTTIDSKGNYHSHYYFKEHELLYARDNRRRNLCGELVKKAVSLVKEKNCSVAIEDLHFKDDSDVQSKFARIKHQFIYSTLLTMLERACKREGIEVIKVKPQFTSKIGLYKYCHQYRLSVHNGAAMVIARRSCDFKERVSKILTDKLISDKESFNKNSEWKKWAILNKIIGKMGGQNPGLWLKNRKEIL